NVHDQGHYVPLLFQLEWVETYFQRKLVPVLSQPQQIQTWTHGSGLSRLDKLFHVTMVALSYPFGDQNLQGLSVQFTLGITEQLVGLRIACRNELLIVHNKDPLGDHLR